jgi:outer membrane protein OmpA-like peptidoglycan-associated protein
VLAGLGLLCTVSVAGAAPPTVKHIALERGLVLVSTLHYPAGERENAVTVEDVSADGVTYTWNLLERDASGKELRESFRRFVRAADLAEAQRLHTVFATRDQAEYPGYTAYSLSSAVFDRLRTSGASPFAIREQDGASGALAGLLSAPSTFKGTLMAVSREPENFPLLVSGTRVSVPALHLKGQFTFREQHIDHELWILADHDHPLLLKSVTGKDVWQMVRVDLPQTFTVLEKSLQTECRAELPGVYFAFGTADLDDASTRTLTGVGEVLSRHADWTLAIEGHTDNIGTPAANQKLSLTRAEAVRTNLINQHGVTATRLSASGFGETKPRESNDTIEGRARNRRVEIVRPCKSST